ncbi:Xaa-Pro peptidase family protein [Aminivibrio sp.]|jgi:Xaa-Pro aminopeptidase|uniref:M24 family metallopeptidase n=1 Tax=Aminivibrio sp. TaxID=1872489 RepID=UPI001A476062|nr:Xaa-Pro peptidase family protein [Aminivibrio sp.]MBL3538985.1 aminopeptidase P family protein [Aminivibrio sp.]
MINRKRVELLAAELKKLGLDAVYLGPSADLEYIGGLDTHPDERVRGLMVSKDGRCFAMTPLLYREEMVNAFGDVPFYAEWNDHEGFTGAFRRGCEHLGIVGGKIAFNDGVRAVDMLAVRDAMDLQMCNGAGILDPLRSRKDEDELAVMREASRIVDEVVGKLRDFIRPGMTERQIAKKIPEFFEEAGSNEISFAPIVAGGPNGSMPHYGGDQRVIEENDVIIIDLGGRYKSYCSDTTRTFFTGTPTEEQKKVYEIVRQAQAAGEAAVKPGATGQDVDRAARQVIIDAGYGEYFFNRVGHGIGLAVHESPYMIEGNDKPLEPGNVFSVEPGIYLPGKFGVRIENIVAVRADGTGEALNHFPRDLDSVCIRG